MLRERRLAAFAIPHHSYVTYICLIMYKICKLSLLLALIAASHTSVLGQEQSNVANPLLVLVRDPAVHADLKLTAAQRNQVKLLTDRLDIPMWKMRGMSLQNGQAELQRLIGVAEKELAGVFTREQSQRFNQIILRAQRLEGLFRRDVAERLQISNEQHAALREMMDATQKELAAINARKNNGEDVEELQKEFSAAQKASAQKLLEIITAEQRLEWTKLMGAEFDLSKLGDVRYKAPEFANGTQWLHSDPLQLEGLRGSVVVIHYMAFG